MDHFAPQSLFATYAERGVDVILRHEAMNEGLDLLARRAGLAQVSHDLPRRPL